MRRLFTLLPLAACLIGVILPLPAEPPTATGLGNKDPLSPREEQATFKVPKGFRVELVACEPEVIDPVAMAFDEQGRIYVAEMRGYPNAGVGTGDISSGKIKRLEDRDGDGFFERATVFAEGLRLPMSVLPWKKGLLVAVAPDILYLEDADGDGKADRKRVLYTGFELANVQQMVNSLTRGIDNWVYGVAGNNAGTVRSVEKPDAEPLTLRNRAFRFRPDMPGSLEPTSGGGQYGLTSDPWGRWFSATNSQHLRHIVLPDHALRRNPSLPVRAVTLDIPDHGPACKVHRISPFEAWRVERTRRRKEGTDSQRFSPTELVPGGYSTSTCGLLYLDSALFPAEYRGSIFVCDPANNLIHRDVLVENGATFIAKRGEEDCEFLASTDNWFRPVWLSLGPDGAIYVLDFYREVIETPLSLPEDIKKQLNLETRGRGRIWRISPEKTPPLKNPALNRANVADLVAQLASDNAWRRSTAQRLLVERQEKSAVSALEALAKQKESSRGRVHALWTLDGLNALPAGLIESALKDPEPGVRELALRLAEERLEKSPALLKAVLPLVEDSSPRVRFQLAITLGASDSPERLPALAAILRKPDCDTWTQTAVLASVGKRASDLLVNLLDEVKKAGKLTEQQQPVVSSLATLVGTSATDAELAKLLDGVPGESADLWRMQVLEEIGNGLRSGSRSLSALLDNPPAPLKQTMARLRPLLDRAAKLAEEPSASVEDRAAAVRLLGHSSFAQAKPIFTRLLAPQVDPALQLAVVRAVTPIADRDVANLLLERWGGYGPTVRRECTEALFARTERVLALLEAVEKKDVKLNQLEPVRLSQLTKHRDAAVRSRAEKLLAAFGPSQRQKVVDAYQSALDLKPDRDRGKMLFKKTCATCHRLENEGHQVGADLLAALKNKTREQLLLDVLDPSREVDPRYQNYLVTTAKGRTVTGLLATETGSSITLRRGEGAEDTLLRTQIDEITATGASLMPDNLETQLTKQDLADLIEYLLTAAR